MHYSYKTHMTCSRNISFDIEDNKLHNVKFVGGCNGNLKAISSLAEGMDADEFVKRCEGITCGFKPTSCQDQFSKAIREAQAIIKNQEENNAEKPESKTENQ